jgi:hypothetical protein
MSVGSLVFVRACNDPPLNALFKHKLLFSDELFGMWLMALAVFPAIPYCFIYLSVSQEGIYYIGFLIAICVLGGLFIFIFSMYPRKKKPDEAERPYREGSYLLYVIQKYWGCVGRVCCCACFSPAWNLKALNWVEVHYSTDWVIATWSIFWASALGLLLFVLFFLYEVSHGLNRLSLFVYITRYVTILLFFLFDLLQHCEWCHDGDRCAILRGRRLSQRVLPDL